MKNQTVSGTKKPLFGGRRPLFTQKELLLLTGPLLVEQLLEVTVGMADTMMVSRCGEAAISGVSLVDSFNVLMIQLLSAAKDGGIPLDYPQLAADLYELQCTDPRYAQIPANVRLRWGQDLYRETKPAPEENEKEN